MNDGPIGIDTGGRRHAAPGKVSGLPRKLPVAATRPTATEEEHGAGHLRALRMR